MPLLSIPAERATWQSQKRLAVLCDYPEEGWDSMELCAEMLLERLPHDTQGWAAIRVCPRFQRYLQRLPLLGSKKIARNADRFINRFVRYPRHVRGLVEEGGVFHIVDHSYAHLVHSLPAARTGVYCHDLDAFRCLLQPESERRPAWFCHLARLVLDGLQKAAVVFHNSHHTGNQLVAAKLVDPARLVHAPLGTAPEFVPEPNEDDFRLPWLDKLRGRPMLLHVGSCIARKRVDILIEVLAALRDQVPGVHLVKVGGDWSDDHVRQIERLGLEGIITHIQHASRAELAALYREAGVVLVPSEAEGFGLPVVEALACGTVVVASDIPVLREVGGPAAVFCPLADVPAWTAAVSKLLIDPTAGPARRDRLAWVRQFTWDAHAQTIMAAYERLLSCS